jgi:hypothetical protein
MIDWIREAISVGFCQLKVKSSRTPSSGKAGWNSRKVSARGSRAGALHDPLQAPAVLRIDDDHDVAAPDRLGDQVGQCHALAGLGGADQQRAALEVLQRPVQRLSSVRRHG